MKLSLIRHLTLTFAGASLLSFAQLAEAETVTVYVAKNPPLICTTDGKLDCIAGKLLKSALESGGIDYKIAELPWARAQDEMSKNPNSIFAATGRNKFTEDKFDWFYKVYTDDVNIYTKSNNKIANDSEITQKAKTVAIRNGSPFFAYATDLKIGVSEVNEWFLGARLVMSDRVNGMLLTTLVGDENFFTIEKNKREDVNRYKIGEMQWFIVRPKGAALTPELTKLSQSLEKAKNSTEYVDLLKSKNVIW